MKKWMTSLFLGAALCHPAAAYDNISMAGEAPFKKIVSRAGGVAVAASGAWLVSDASGGCVRAFGADGKPKGVIGAKGKGADQLNEPRGLAVDEGGNVYAADAGRDRVAVFSPDGKFIRALGMKGAGAGQLSGPQGVAVSPDGVVYVADTGNNRVQLFSRDGLFLSGFGAAGEAEGQFKNPTAVALSPTGRLYVMDQKRVQVFTTTGKYIGPLDRPRADVKDAAPPAPAGLAADRFGFVYVAGAHQKVEEYGADGRYIASFGTYGTGAGQFKELSGLAASPEGVVLALDAGLQRVQGFRPTSDERAHPLAPGPTLRFSVRTLGTRALVADDIAFAGDALAAVTRKPAQLLLAGRGGADAPKVLAGGKGKGVVDPLDGPAGVFAAGDRFLIADEGNGRVAVRGLDGKAVGGGAIGSAGKRDGQFKSPVAVAADAAGRVIVADAGLNRVQMFSPDGIFLRSFPGPFQSAVDVAPLPGKVAVLDAGRKAVLYFDDKGRAVGKPAEGFLQPVSVAADPRGRLDFVYALDAGDGQVKVVSGGEIVARFGSPSLFNQPRALAVDGKGAVWVADAAGVKGFEVRLSPLAPTDFEAKAGEAQIALSWKKDPEGLAEGFRLFRSTQGAGAAGAPFRVFSSTENGYIDREIVPGLTYHYALAAVALDAGGEKPLEGARASAQAVTQRPANLPPVDIADFSLERIFSAQYKTYEREPVGKVLVKNNTEKTFQKVRVGFILQNYMDFVTEKIIDRLEPGALESVDLRATFNNKILSVTEDTPIQAQLTLTYYDNGEEKIFKRAEPLTLYSRNAMSWEDLGRLATFITARDPAALEFGRGIVRDFQKEIESSPVNPNLSKAALVFEGLGAYGLSYLKDPNNALERASENARVIDYVQYPRETLKRKTGDCDDLTALTAALLEAASVPTALIDVPGHVFLAFRLDDDFPLDPGLPEGSFLVKEGVRWVPLETTFIGRSFMDAWEQGAKTLRLAPPDKIRFVETAEAWEAYAPATLTEEPGPASPKKEEVQAKFPSGGVKALAQARYETLSAESAAALKKDPKDAGARLQLGILDAEHGKLEEAAKALDELLAQAPADAAALNNRGNVAWLQGGAAQARAFYDRAAAADPKDAGVRLNLARAALKSGDKAKAKEAFAAALALDPSLKKEFAAPEDLLKK